MRNALTEELEMKMAGKPFPAAKEDFELYRNGVERNELDEKAGVFVKRRGPDEYRGKQIAARQIDRFLDDAFNNSHGLAPPSDYFKTVARDRNSREGFPST